MMGAVLRLQDVTKAYGKRTAVTSFSLEIAPGESVAMLGPSGCGKTTVLRLIAGLERPDSGEIWIDNRQVASDGHNTVPASDRQVGLVFQDLALWPHLNVRDNLAFVVESTALRKSEREARIDEFLKICRIDHGQAGRYPHELSGGEQQRVALARALVGFPRVLLLDEPFSNLDAALRASLREELAAMQHQLRVTTIYVTHDPADAAALANRTIVMREGRIENSNL